MNAPSSARHGTALVIAFICMSAASLAGGCAANEEGLQVSPRPEVVRLRGDTVLRTGGLSLEPPQAFQRKFAVAADTLRARLSRTGGTGDTVPVRVRVLQSGDSRDSVSARALSHPEGYVLRIGPEAVRVVASTQTGVLRGLTTLEEMARGRGGRLPAGSVADWPDHPTRAFHFVLRDVAVESARRLVNLARENQFNTLIVQLADGVALPSLEEIARPDAWSPEELASFADYTRQNGLEFVPEIKLLTHQGKLLKGHYPELMYNSKTYDPRSEETYRLVSRILDDVIDTVRPDAVHIGHDEVAGVGSGERARKQLGPGEQPLPARLFLEDVRRVHGMLEARNVETWMWGDMLVAPSEFPGMLERHLHGTSAYASLRGKLPEDIVICDWHYSDRQDDFPTLRAFLEAGHPVLGATWRRASTTRRYSRYAESLNRPRVRGMIATTWWLVQRGRWEQLAQLAEFSGSVFWNADPAGESTAAAGRGNAPTTEGLRGRERERR